MVDCRHDGQLRFLRNAHRPIWLMEKNAWSCHQNMEGDLGHFETNVGESWVSLSLCAGMKWLNGFQSRVYRVKWPYYLLFILDFSAIRYLPPYTLPGSMQRSCALSLCINTSGGTPIFFFFTPLYATCGSFGPSNMQRSRASLLSIWVH